MAATVPQTLHLNAALQQAENCRQAGLLQEAERLFRAILQAQPNNPEANYSLGLMALQANRPAAGLPHFKAALEANPNHGRYRLGYIDALIWAGQKDAARKVLAQGRQRGMAGAEVEAIAARLAGERKIPKHPGAVKRTPPAPRATRQPGDQEIHALVALFNAGRHSEMESRARLTCERYPDSGVAWKALGAALQMQGKDALAVLQRAAELLPDDAEVHSNLGNTLREIGQLDGAVASCRRALELKPDLAEAHNNLGNALKDLWQLDDAAASYAKALEIDPDYADAYINLARTLANQGKVDDAIAFSRKAIDVKPFYSQAHCNLGNALKDKCLLREAGVSFLKATSLQPESSASLTAAIKLAILSHLQTDLPRASEMLALGRPALEKRDHSDRSMQAYYRYMDHLLRWWRNNAATYQSDNTADTLYVIGESHVLSAHNLPILNSNRTFRCRSMWIEGCKQWHLGCGAYNQYKYQFEAIMQSLPRHAAVLMVLGEIDCRPDEGIVRAWKKSPDKNIEDIASATVANYLRYVSQIAAERDHKIIICGVPASNALPGKLAEEEIARLQRLLIYFNSVLRDKSLASGMDFLDVFSMTDSGNGASNGLWHIDFNHLRPDAIIEAFEKHYLGAKLPTGDNGDQAAGAISRGVRPC